MSLSHKLLDHPVLVLCAFVLTVLVSVFAISGIQIDLFPKMDEPVVMVFTQYDNAGPESVEKSVTKLLEEELENVPNLKKMTSQSSEGISSIVLQFTYGTNLDSAVNDIRDKLDLVRAELPSNAGKPGIYKYDSSSEPVMMLSLSGPKTAEQLRQIADTEVKKRLEQTPGIARASVYGGRKTIVRIELDQNRLEAYGLTMHSVAEMLSAQNVELGGGSVFEGTRKYLVRTTGGFSSLEEINAMSVGSFKGCNVALSDIGHAFLGFGDKTEDIQIDGADGVYVALQKQSGGNTVRIADAAYEKIEEINNSLPHGVHLEIIQDDSIEVRATLTSLVSSMAQGFLLAVAVLLLFLRNAKGTLIMAVSIPFSMLITIAAMLLFNITLNIITMTGLILGLGMVVDASVVVLENICVYRERGASSKVAAALGAQEVMLSVISGNLTTICVFVPFFIYKNRLEMTGALFSSLTTVIIIALAVSLIVAMLLVPVLAGKFLPVSVRAAAPVKNRLLCAADAFAAAALEKGTELYRRGLRAVLHHRFAAAVLSAALLASSLLCVRFLSVAYMPEFNPGVVTMNMMLPPGTRLEETRNILDRFYEIIRRDVRGTQHIIVSAGTDGDDNASSHKGSITITLPDAAHQLDSADTVRKKLRAHFEEFPAAQFGFSDDAMEQMAGSDVKLVFRSDNLDAVRAAAGKLKLLIEEKIPELADVKTNIEDGLPQAEIRIDRARAANFGVSVRDIADEITFSVNGCKATVFRHGGTDYDVLVLLADSDRSRVPDLEKIFVTCEKGRIPVANFACIERGAGPVSIHRLNRSRAVELTARITGSIDAATAGQRIRNIMQNDMILPDGVSVSFDGSWKETVKQLRLFAVIAVLAVLLVFGVMAGTYESFKEPFINLFTLPFLVPGVVAVHLALGKDLSIVSMLGVVMLIGIVVNNGIILVDKTNLLVRRGTSLMEACEKAAVSRLRPVLMTTLTTVLGMAPMAFFADANSSLTQPVGLCIVGGLLSSTAATLFLIPAVYSLINRNAVKQEKTDIPAELAALLAEECREAFYAGSVNTEKL